MFNAIHRFIAKFVIRFNQDTRIAVLEDRNNQQARTISSLYNEIEEKRRTIANLRASAFYWKKKAGRVA